MKTITNPSAQERRFSHQFEFGCALSNSLTYNCKYIIISLDFGIRRRMKVSSVHSLVIITRSLIYLKKGTLRGCMLLTLLGSVHKFTQMFWGLKPGNKNENMFATHETSYLIHQSGNDLSDNEEVPMDRLGNIQFQQMRLNYCTFCLSLNRMYIVLRNPPPPKPAQKGVHISRFFCPVKLSNLLKKRMFEANLKIIGHKLR